MKTIILTIFSFLTTGLLLAQPIPQWSSSINTNFNLYIYGNPKIKFDNAGDLIVVGNIDNGANGKDILLLKFSPSGSILWQQIFNSVYNKDDEAIDFEVDVQNNILVTGRSNIDSVNGDMITIKYNSNGDYKWMNSFNGIANRVDAGLSITIDPSGTSYVTGFTSIDTLDHRKMVTTKIDSGGNTIWTRYHGTDTLASYVGEKIKIVNNEIVILGWYVANAISRYVAVKLDTSGAVLLSNEGEITKGMSSFFIDNLGNFYFGAVVAFKITKINSDGTFAWSDTAPTNLPSNTSGDEVRAIIVDSLQNVYITGRHYGDDYGGPAYSNADILTIKYSASGNKIWSKRYEYLSNNAADIGNDITLDPDLNVYVAGQSERNLTDYDYVVVKYDVNGNEKGTIRYNDSGSGDDVITSIVVADSSNIFVTGVTFDNLLSSTTTQKYGSVSGVGIFEINLVPISLSAFPNPFSNTTFIHFPNTDNDVFNFQLFDNSGKIILNQKTKDDKVEISADNLPAGLYTFILLSDRKNYNGKIIKTK